MSDLASIQDVLASIKTATGIARSIRRADASPEKAESKMKLAELLDALAQAKTKIAGIEELLLEKDRRIRELEQATDIRGRRKNRTPFY